MSDSAALIPNVVPGDWKGVNYALRLLARKLGTTANVIFNSITVTDGLSTPSLTITGLTASRLIATNASKTLASVANLAAWVAGGTSVTVTDDGDGTVTLAVDPAGVDHDQLLNFASNEHYLQTAITNVSSALATGLLKVTTGTGALSVVADASTNWNTAYSHVSNNGTDHSYIDQSVTTTADPTFDDLTLTGVLKLPTTSATVGQILKNASPWIHAYGTNNFFAGIGAGNLALTTSQNNVGIGTNALNDLTTGSANVAIGSNAGTLITGGGSNFCLGSFAGDALTTGTQNLAIGVNSLTECVDKSGNVALGYYALGGTTGQTNIGIGGNAGRHQTTGNNNVMVGYQAGDAASDRALTGCVFLGYLAGYGSTTDNQLYIANSSTATPLLYGTFPNTLLRVNAPLEIRAADTFCIGDATVDGSWQFIRSGNNLLIQRRESGSWVTKSTISA